MKPATKTGPRVEKLIQLLKGKGYLLIVMQDNPDPDSIASAVGLRRLANSTAQVQCSIAYSGTVGRGENRALVNYLNLNLHQISNIDFKKFDLIAMVDTQPGTGNNSLPQDLTPNIVIDHHPCRDATRSVELIDIRSGYGSTSTILCEYLHEAEMTPEIPLATALLYGIRSDTQDLGREATKADIEAIEWLYPLANKRMLSEIQRGSEPREYFQMLAEALKNARIYGNAIVTTLGQIDNPDMIGEVADLLMREEKTRWTMCMGLSQGKVLVSLRTADENNKAENVVKQLVDGIGTGGGHQTYAGGQIPLKENTRAELTRMERKLRRTFVRLIGAGENHAVKLIARKHKEKTVT
ncbi:MAG: bifunctional oligoribonuclease/PAP phosphatase NrnA [Sedimentisphaerales bacterium]|nr:bifunctional oligoribonuclease/PAP phosphatase NrnA [Sedimentisphaerales bacterium]